MLEFVLTLTGLALWLALLCWHWRREESARLAAAALAEREARAWEAFRMTRTRSGRGVRTEECARQRKGA